MLNNQSNVLFCLPRLSVQALARPGLNAIPAGIVSRVDVCASPDTQVLDLAVPWVSLRFFVRGKVNGGNFVFFEFGSLCWSEGGREVLQCIC